MKRKVTYIIYIISIIYIIILYYNKYIIAQEQLLTKNLIFDIIEDVEDIVISCITKSGNKSMSEENKIDFAINYIIVNREKYSSEIPIEKNSAYNAKEENILHGRISREFLDKVIDKYFYSCNYPIEEYKFYKDGVLELRTEPSENICWDRKEFIGFQIEENICRVNLKYTRILNNIINDFYVEYVFDISNDIKIKNVTIYNSIMN